LLRVSPSDATDLRASLVSRNVAICCIWPLEPGLQQLMARKKNFSSPPRSRRWLEMAARARPGAAEFSKSAARVCPGAAECSTGAARVCPGTAECSTGAARATPEAQNARRVPLEPAQEPQHARKVPLEPTAVRCVRFLRSKWPFEKCCPLFVFYRDQLLLGSTLLRACYARAHTSIYICIYIEKADATPPHLEVFLRLGGSLRVHGSVQFFAFGLFCLFPTVV